MSDTHDVPVLVVGGGPVGLSTAFFLATQGVRPLVVERRGGTGQHPRANSSARTVELFRAGGLAGDLDRVGWRPRNPYLWVLKDRGVGDVLDRSRLPARFVERVMSCTPAPRLMVTSDRIERLLLSEILARGGEVRFDTDLVGVDADDRRVRATLVDAGGERREITCAYLVAADGANSTVRSRLGLTMPDREVAGTVHTAFYRASIADPRYEREARFCFVRNDDVYAAIGSLNGDDLWTTHIMSYPGKPEHPEPLTRERTVRLVRAAIGDPAVSIELLAANTWEATLGIASAFRRGRVFLAGDAAHVQTSAGGLGMNTGIQDGHNLAWKLAAVLRGHAGPALLDSYEAERRLAATASVDISRVGTLGVGIGASDRPRLHAQLGEFEAYLRAMMFYGYRSSAVITGERDDDLDVYRDEARPGYRMPHHWLVSNGTRVSTTDLAGPDWLLLTGPQGRQWLGAASALDVPVRAYQVLDEPDADALGDPERRFLDLAGIGPDGAVLVRPDGFVCWRAATLDPQGLPAVLGRVLSRDSGDAEDH
ncbi:FAD-dependent monooxygenase [Pseudonocardia acaciae]|uniref:FAD-dependent monooxygenase n=1 Tax=Pseudonocardia acaciae TaxID=551276 RepID=UPI00048EFDBF|nr:FAD-dependent monooxygenase [Pseudonocardia acaciae]